ncbi:hypothetical protein [Agrococcus baldri]|uniref:Uncharacterized protein n=1 Tax=Agrococcus baldri TaxID=153730 RepID=A0AA87US33_9MICO|nr:hypothetical protein [Agrococcus baldri]GEK80581.1 hypothetical protein ABA31_19320 [Agrococcus baldri]
MNLDREARQQIGRIQRVSDVLNVSLPKPVTAATAEFDRMVALIDSLEARDPLAAALKALADGRDPYTDPDVRAAHISRTVASQESKTALTYRAHADLLDVYIEHAGDVVDSWKAPFTAAAQSITDAREALKGRPLDDAAGIVALGGDAARHYADAREAIANIRAVVNGWTALSRMAGNGTITERSEWQIIATHPGDPGTPKADPYELAGSGFTLALADFDEHRARQQHITTIRAEEEARRAQRQQIAVFG